jgi:hypothetical protein
MKAGRTIYTGSSAAGRDKQVLRKNWFELDGRRAIGAWRIPCGDTAIQRRVSPTLEIICRKRYPFASAWQRFLLFAVKADQLPTTRTGFRLQARL